MGEEYYIYENPQFLGKEGITIPCKKAIVAILTSAFLPEKVTLVSLDRNGPDLVLFIVWDWFYPGATIISDGFGTHGGEGGRGLSAVLGLLAYYKIPLYHARLDDKTAFYELAQGRWSAEIFDTLRESEHPFNERYYPASLVKKKRKGKMHVLEIVTPNGAYDFEIVLPER